MKQVRVALVGAGFMASNHARVISESARATLGVVVDVDCERAHDLASRFGVEASTALDSIRDCEVVVVASPTETHAAIALEAIKRGINILIEKPLAATMSEVESICSAALDAQVALSCGFVERFNPVIQAAKGYLEEEPIHIVAIRHSPAIPRISQSVIHDLLIHDLDLAMRFWPERLVERVGAVGWPTPDAREEIVDCSIQFAGGAIATLSASRMSQRKIRSMHIFAHSTMLELDLLRSDLTIYRNVRQEQPDPLTYRAETTVDIPFVRHSGEPLALQFDRFLDVVEGDQDVRRREIQTIIGPHELAHWVEREASDTTSGRDVELSRQSS